MKKIEKLVNIIIEKFNIELDPSSFVRTRAGYFQRSSGAFSWAMSVNGNVFLSYGSCESVTDLLKNKECISLKNREFFLKHEILETKGTGTD